MSNKRVHILGIGGTFMAGLALLAKTLGWQVSGQDLNLYDPMKTQLAAAGIECITGYEAEYLAEHLAELDYVIIGNALSRGMPVVEFLLRADYPLLSGPEFLKQHLLYKLKQKVFLVTGTHGKTTTASMLAWVLTYAGLKPNYLIGGCPRNFEHSAALVNVEAGGLFVLEGDEYDTAFFDKRPKFLHYKPNYLLINNLEFDHADIYADLAVIERQFQYLLRLVPDSGKIYYNELAENVALLVAKQSLVQAQAFSWARIELLLGRVYTEQVRVALATSAPGAHNLSNAAAVISCLLDFGLSAELIAAALTEFKGVKRRMELLAQVNRFQIYEDFAHHPTALVHNLEVLLPQVNNKRANNKQVNNKIANNKINFGLIAVLDLGSNSFKLGVHNRLLAEKLLEWLQQIRVSYNNIAVQLVFYLPDVKSDTKFKQLQPAQSAQPLQPIIDTIVAQLPDSSSWLRLDLALGVKAAEHLLHANLQAWRSCALVNIALFSNRDISALKQSVLALVESF